MTVTEFRARLPEFAAGTANGETSMVQAALDAAARETDSAVFGDDTEDAILWLAADILASTPNGQAARLKATAGTGFRTVYGYQRERLETIHVGGAAGWLV